MTLRFKGNIKPSGSLRANAGPQNTNWWDENAALVIDGSVGTLGGNDIVSQVGDMTLIAGASSSFSDEETRDGRAMSWKMSDVAGNLGGLTRYIRTGATQNLLAELGSFTIEFVSKRSSSGQYAMYYYLNYKAVGQNLSDRTVLAEYDRGSSGYWVNLWLNTTNPTNINGTSSPKSNTAWSHYLITYDANTGLYAHYLDGVLSASITYILPESTLQEEYFGCYTSEVYLDRYQIVPGVKYTENFTPEI